MGIKEIRAKILKDVPKPLLLLYRFIRYPEEPASLVRFAFRKDLKISFSKRLEIIRRVYLISYNVDCPHTQYEMLEFMSAVLTLSKSVKGCIVEAGCYKGGSTAKFSVAAKISGRKLIVFDSFGGFPENKEPNSEFIFGGSATFPKGGYKGTLSEVKRNVGRYGDLGVCTFVKGWFDATMPKFSKPIAAVFLDVDLSSSTRTCLKYLYPLLTPGGVLYSHDGHLPLVVDVFRDSNFWKKEVGCSRPYIEGLGKRKLVKIIKPTNIKKDKVK